MTYAAFPEFDDTPAAEYAEARAFDDWAEASMNDAALDDDDYDPEAGFAYCPHCDGILHGPTDYCWCAGCDACDRARGYVPTEPASCPLCDGSGRYWDHGYVATEGGTLPPVEGPCPAGCAVPVITVECLNCSAEAELADPIALDAAGVATAAPEGWHVFTNNAGALLAVCPARECQ